LLFCGLWLHQAPESPANQIRVELAPPRDISTVLRVKALVGNRGASVFHVFEIEQKLPKFAMYVPTNDARVVAQPKSSAVFQVRRQPSLALH
jgi:hypothetical protein